MGKHPGHYSVHPEQPILGQCLVFESNSMETDDLQPARIISAIIIISSCNHNDNNGGENVGR